MGTHNVKSYILQGDHSLDQFLSGQQATASPHGKKSKPGGWAAIGTSASLGLSSPGCEPLTLFA